MGVTTLRYYSSMLYALRIVLHQWSIGRQQPLCGNYTYEYVILFQLKPTYSISSIHQQYPSYSSAVRLAKRWISAQMLLSFLQEEAVELIVAHLYLHPAPYNVTASPQTGFLRFLKLLTSHDWKTVPLIVNLSGELSSKYTTFKYFWYNTLNSVYNIKILN